MAILTAYNFYFAIATTPGSTATVDLSNRCTALKVNMPQAANEAQAAGNTHKVYRPGPGDPSIEATFRRDDALLNIRAVLQGHLGITSTGFTVAARPINGTISSANPEYGGQGIISGDLMVVDDNWGDVPTISVKIVPYSAWTVVTTSS